MLVIRKRLIYWLIKAYFKKSKKILFFSFLSGLIIFAAVVFGSRYIKAILSFTRQPVIGIVGSYEQTKLPDTVVEKLSRGLTEVQKDGSVEPDIADRFSIEDGGRVYRFSIREGLKFNDGSALTSENLIFNFTDVEVERPDERTIVFKLRDPYAPFLATVSRPVFKEGFVGLGSYNIGDVELNGNFVQNITLRNRENRFELLKYIFYPSEEALKTAFALGEITEARGIVDISYQGTAFDKYPNTTVEKATNYDSLVTLFYNTSDPVLSDRKIRLGLNHALPGEFEGGVSNHLPYPPVSFYYNSDIGSRVQDLERAAILMPDEKPTLKIKFLSKYKNTAAAIAKEWEKIGIKAEIEEVDQVPDLFQVFLGEFNMPIDPDQYALWHSNQSSNISRLANLRIDKLLEDGRKTTAIGERKKIYNDFQKFLLEEMPASFLFFPEEHTVRRD